MSFQDKLTLDDFKNYRRINSIFQSLIFEKLKIQPFQQMHV